MGLITLPSSQGLYEGPCVVLSSQPVMWPILRAHYNLRVPFFLLQHVSLCKARPCPRSHTALPPSWCGGPGIPHPDFQWANRGSQRLGDLPRGVFCRWRMCQEFRGCTGGSSRSRGGRSQPLESPEPGIHNVSQSCLPPSYFTLHTPAEGGAQANAPRCQNLRQVLGAQKYECALKVTSDGGCEIDNS